MQTNTLVQTLLTMTLFQLIKTNLPYSIQQINDKSGIFYLQFGQAGLSHDKFTLLSYTNISIYEEKLKLTTKMYQTSLPTFVNS